MAIILVTGGCGFIGSQVVSHLVAVGHDVRVLDVSPLPAIFTGRVDFIQCSTDNPETLDAAFDGTEHCVHLAGTGVLSDPRAYLADMIDPFMAAADLFFAAAARAGVPVVFASSAAVYGETADLPITEAAPLHPRTAHGLEKLALESSAARHAADTGLPSVALRMFNVYGPGQSPASPYCGVVRLFAERLLTGEKATVYGDGTHARDFIFIDDVADIIAQAVVRPFTGTTAINLCTGRATTILELIDILEMVTGRRLDPTFVNEPQTEVSSSVGDPVRAERDLGFKATVSLEAGIRKLMSDLTTS